MKRWLKLEILPLVLLLALHAKVFAVADLTPLQMLLAAVAFLLVPALAGVFYGRVVGRTELGAVVVAEQTEHIRRLRGELGVAAELLDDAARVIFTVTGDDDDEERKLRRLGELMEQTVLRVKGGV